MSKVFGYGFLLRSVTRDSDSDKQVKISPQLTFLPPIFTHFPSAAVQNKFYAKWHTRKYPNFRQYQMKLICFISAPLAKMS